MGVRRRTTGGVFRNRSLQAGALIVVIVILAAALGPWIVRYDPDDIDIAIRFQKPNPDHLLGTDHYGRDVLARLVEGARIALSVGFGAVAIGLVAGVILGAIAGMRGGWVGELIMRFMDALLAFPGILLAIALIAVLGPGYMNSALAIGIVNVPVFARLSRASVLSLKNREFVEAARSLGAGETYILFKHILPNASGPIIAQAGVSFAYAILAEASLSFLGLGTQPPLASWGRMLDEARNFIYQAPWLAIFPGLAIGIVVLGFNLLADGLQSLLNPKNR